MNRIMSVITVTLALACGNDGGGGPSNQGDVVVSLGALPATIAANADSAFIRVRNAALGVNDVRRMGLPATGSTTVTVAAGSGYEVTVVALISGPAKLAIGGDVVTGLTVPGEGSVAATMGVIPFGLTLLELADTLIQNSPQTMRVALIGGPRAVSDNQPVGVNLFLTMPPMNDVYFPGSATDRFFSGSSGDTLLFNITVPVTTTDEDLYFHVRWSASTADADWTARFPFEIALPTLALGDTLWRRPVDGTP